MTQIICHDRSKACLCRPDECRSAPQPAVSAPSLNPEPRDYLAVIAFAVVMAIIAAGTMHALNRQEVQFKIEARV
jgi:hypothetical protein